MVEGENSETRENHPKAIVDLNQLGKAMILLGFILLMCYVPLMILSFLVETDPGQAMFNMWGGLRFVSVVMVCSILMLVGYAMSKRFAPV